MKSATTVLIVDDDREIRELIGLYLKNEGYDVLQAANGEEALEQVKSRPVDLIVLDRMMPGMDGVQVCIRLREEHRMPIIMLTAKAQDMDKIEGLSVGADDYVTKPFNPLELVARIKAQAPTLPDVPGGGRGRGDHPAAASHHRPGPPPRLGRTAGSASHSPGV
ncbi:response regulator receiver domain-containing protein [Planifilum fimeticola]|uniref:Response regulator receiver domain-containing protein n=1 Tax=Planifilum fimeticola TaxID=201975 RepID=A0A2T0LEE7_9BACL|nr:response regulator receiver domain-containing protein [Planifilum fimeticola]